MSHDTTTSDPNYDIIVALGDAAWTLLATDPIDEIDIDSVADMAGVDEGLAVALAGNVQYLVLAKMTQLDRQSLRETYDDIQDAGEVSIRESIMESLLHWFETYKPFRSQIHQLNRSARSHPELALRLLSNLEAMIRRTLVLSGDPALGLRGVARVKGVTGVFLATARVWMTDDSNDLAATMKELDRRMSQGEEWGISLHVFDGRRSHEGPDDSVSKNKRGDVAAQYGVDND